MKTYVAVAALALAAVPMLAQNRTIDDQAHSWGNYHWKRTGPAVTPPVHNNLSSGWQTYFTRAMADWNAATYIQSPYGSAYGPISTPRKCSSDIGKIEVCNATYGQNGWLGIAGISLSGGHIAKGYTKLNDSYFNTAYYDKASWRRMVTCQEIGHDYGLGHVNENFDDPNTGSCMDYSNDPGRNDGKGTNEYPNAHDYAMLDAIYAHVDSAASPIIDEAVSAYASHTKHIEELMANADQWGTPISFDAKGRPNVFMMRVISPNHGDDDHGDGVNLTHVFWAPVDPFEGERPNVDHIN